MLFPAKPRHAISLDVLLGMTGVAIAVVAHLLHAWHYSFLTDDAFISFRYARNLVLHGELTYNLGEHVEGFSNFLWVVHSVLGLLLGVLPENSATPMSMCYSLATMVLSLVMLRELVPRRGYWLCAAAVALLLAINRSYATWATSGLETRSNTFWILLGIHGMVRVLRGKSGALLSGIAWAMACLSRPDSPPLLAVGFATVFIWRREWGTLLRIGLPPTLAWLGLTAFRIAYFGDWLPNTYYAKVTAPWWHMGAIYLGSWVVEYGLWLWLPVIVGGLFVQRRRISVAAVVLFAALAATQLIYLARLGGDHFEYRPLDFLWPLLSITLVMSLRGMVVMCSGALRTVLAVGVFILIILSVAIPFLSDHEERKIDSYSKAISTPVLLPASLKSIPLLSFLGNMWQKCQAAMIPHSSGTRSHEHRLMYATLDTLYRPLIGLRESGIIPSDIVSVTRPAGVYAYYLDATVVDFYGLNDRTIARTPINPSETRVLGHERSPPEGYLEERGINFEEPRVLSAVPPPDRLKPDHFAYEVFPKFYLTFTSRKHDWVQQSFHQRCVVFDGKYQ